MSGYVLIILGVVGLLWGIAVLIGMWQRRQQDKTLLYASELSEENSLSSRKMHGLTSLNDRDMDALVDASMNVVQTEEKIKAALSLADEIIDQNPLKPKINLTDIVTISLRSRMPRGFYGRDLVRSLRSCGFHINKQQVFIRYRQEDGSGEQMLQCIQSVEPGIFNMENIEDDFIQAITLLFVRHQVSDPATSFDLLIRIAKQLSFKLNAELLDKDFKPLTLPTIDMYRKEILS